MSKSISKRLSDLEADKGLDDSSALVSELPGGLYSWCGHEDRPYTLDEIHAQLPPGTVILVMDLPTSKAEQNGEVS